MISPRWLLVLMLVYPTAWATKPLPGWTVLGAAELKATFAGKTLGDGFHYSYQFHPDGSLKGVEMAKDVKGTWVAEGKTLCLHREKPRKHTECFEVHTNGCDVNMLDRGALVFRGTLSDMEVKP